MELLLKLVLGLNDYAVGMPIPRLQDPLINLVRSLNVFGPDVIGTIVMAVRRWCSHMNHHGVSRDLLLSRGANRCPILLLGAGPVSNTIDCSPVTQT
jgi:hypothetical protein